MAVFRIERTRDYTVMSNHHLKDSALSLKAKGLLSMMLSLPEEWNYTTRGLAKICKEGVDAIGGALKELEKAGYIVRRQLRGPGGRISDTEYTIYEKPRPHAEEPPEEPGPDTPPPDTASPDTENPDMVEPDMEGPDTDMPAELNTKRSNKNQSITHQANTHSFLPPTPPAEGMTDVYEKREEIREQIEYNLICTPINRAQVDEFVEIMLEVAMTRSPTIKIGRDAEYTDPTGHTPGEWIVDQEAAQGVEGSRHKECTVCGEVLETEELEQLYNQATTDSQGEAVVGRYLVIVTDTDTTDPVANATVTLHGDDTISIRLPNSRLLDYDDQTTVTVLLSEPETPVEGMEIAVTDKNANACGGTTDAAGQITVPGTTGTTNGDGNTTVGWEDADGSRHTLTIKVERTETGRPIQGSEVSMGTTGNITVDLPDGQDMDARNRVTVTVTDNEKAPLPDKTVIVKADLGGTAQGQTNKDGKLTVPSVESAYTDENGEAVVGQYTVIVSTIEEQPVEGALVTLLPGEDEAKDAFTVLLPSGRLLDGNDQTVVTVLLPDTTPAKGLNVEVSDAKGNYAARDTDKNGQITVPDATGTAGEIIGTDTGNPDKSNTVNVDVADQDGKPVDGAEIAVDEDGEVSVTLPDAFDFDEDGPVTVTVTDNQGEAKPGVPVTVTDGTGTTAAGETDKDGAVTLPDEYHFAYIVGYGDGTVGPDRDMSRAEAAAIFARILSETRGEDLPDGRSSRFPDVDPDAWYAGYVAYLEKLGVVVGYDDGKFHAEASITREQFVTVCARLADWMELETYETDQGSFPDVTRDHWAARYVREATRNGWVVGYPDGLFHGEDEITRAEVVTIVNRMLGRVADETYIRRNEDELNTFHDLQNPHYWAYYDLMEAANGHTIVTGAEEETWHEVK